MVQTRPVLHALQTAPLAPHASAVSPLTQSPSAVQQPPHVRGEQSRAGVPQALSEMAAVKRNRVMKVFMARLQTGHP